MLKHSGGYIPINPNFVVGINEEQVKNIDVELQGIVSIIHNILFRGVPTKPSHYLKNNIGQLNKLGGYKYCYGNSDLEWDLVIKGGDEKNPALEFYNLLKEKFPEDYHFFIPECPFDEIIENKKYSKGTSVDFYDPFHRIVIEIDGKQHKEKESLVMDQQRDRELRRQNIQVIRIPTENIYTNSLEPFFLSIRNRLKIKAEYIEFKSELTEIEKQYLFAFRFQVALLVAIEKGFINIFDKSMKINIVADIPVDIELCQTCLKDLEEIFINLYKLLNKDIKFCDIDIVFDDDQDKCDLTIDIGLFGKYDQRISNVNKKRIMVRNSYFFYPVKNKKNLSYSLYKNYFSVKTSSLRFKNVDHKNEEHHKSLLYFLKLLFNFDNFRPYQEEIVCSGLNPRNGVIGLLPTGSGKSICFQLVGMLTPGVSVVVSPLTSLMEDQCDNLYKRHQISSTGFINSTDVGKINGFAFKNNQLKFVYISPERFFNNEFKKNFARNISNMAQITIDEVHCLSEWGHDFRTSYLLLFGFFKSMQLSPNTLLMGTSGTASLRVLNDISKEYGKLNKEVIIKKSRTVNRDELTFQVYETRNKDEKLSEKIKEFIEKNEKVVVFMPFRSSVYKSIGKLKLEDYADQIGLYMGSSKSDSDVIQQDNEAKKQIIQNLKSGKLKVIIATKAFGMGIDIPDIRHTIHCGIGASIESMYQEMGRAGRDKSPSDCSVFFEKHKNDKELLSKDPDLEVIKESFAKDNKLETKIKPVELANQFWLITSSNTNPDIESLFTHAVFEVCKNINGIASIEDIYSKLRDVGYNIVEKKYPGTEYYHQAEYKDNYRTALEKALYKLYLLKLIDLWCLNYEHSYENPLYGNIEVIERTPEEINTALTNYIQTYDSSYEIPDITHSDNHVKLAIDTICNWGFKNFFMTRWASLRTLYDILENFTTSEEFANRVDNYFSDNKILEEAVKNENNYKLWFKVLNSQSIEVLKDQINRYTEEYDNVSVNFISGIVYLQLNDFKNINGKSRLIKSLTQLSADISISFKYGGSIKTTSNFIFFTFSKPNL